MYKQFTEIYEFIHKMYNEDGFIPLHAPLFKGNEKKYLLDVIDSTFVSSVGEYVNQFEQMMTEISGAKYAIATVNGTSALHASLVLAGVEKDSEVITQALTFVATANAISYCGATPIFCDVDLDTMGLCPKAVENFLQENCELRKDGCYNKNSGAKVSACVPMHTFGHPCHIEELVELCKLWQISIVEDAAESLGSSRGEKHTGTSGLLGAVSFNGNKIVTCGGGGAILTNDKAIAKHAKHLTTTAKVPHPYEYMHDEIAFNYRMPNLNAALACAQLEMLDEYLINKRKTANRYQEFFAKFADIEFITEPTDCTSNYWLNAIRFNDKKLRDSFLASSNKAGVMTRPIWCLMNRLPAFSNYQRDALTNSQLLEASIVNIPSGVIA